jgi:hypothetical protein
MKLPGFFSAIYSPTRLGGTKLKRQKLIGWFTCVLGLTIFAHSQAVPTASRPGELQLGAGYSIVSPDYAQKKDMGPTFYVTFDFTSHLGVEADAHIASVSAPADIGEDSYLIGPRYVIRHKRFEPYFKALFGIGVLSFQADNAPHYSQSQFAYALGGGLDLRATHSINIRCFDFEYQGWSLPPNGLSPTVITFGAAYKFH